MSAPLFSASWYRVAKLRPRIRSHARFHRHRYRGQLWYVLQDRSTGRAHRLTPAAYTLAGLMNGSRTADEIWEAANTQLGDDGPTQDETIRLLGLLHAADVLQCDVSPDTAELLDRSQRRDSKVWWRRLLNPLSIRIPLVDPERFLARGTPAVRWLFTWPAAVVWCAVVMLAALAGVTHWDALVDNAATRLLDPRNLLLLAVVYPLVKAVHELGHAFATKVWGGEVHEMGIVFLVLAPIPYVDASAASAFPDKWQRVAVGAAGMAVELFLAALAMFVWLAVEPGAVRLIAWDVMWIGCASTLLFNGNPLLKFDAYYMLADAIEIPNLQGRSRQYLGYIVMKRVFGLDAVRNPVMSRGEGPWFVFYGVASFIYRFFILFTIALFIAGKFFLLGVLIALVSVGVGVVAPLVRVVAFLLSSPRLEERRTRALGISLGTALLVAGFLLFVPIPLMTIAHGVVWPPEGAQVRARADGFVGGLLVAPGARVRAGQVLILTRAPSLEAEVAVLEAELWELEARYQGLERSDLVRAQITLDEMSSVEAELERAREQVREVSIESPGNGRFLMASSAEDLPGRFVRKGQLLGYVVGPAVTTARVVVPQRDIALVRERTSRVDLRLAARLGEVSRTAIRRHVPAARQKLPSPALGNAGGGLIPVDPLDPDGLRTLENVFELEVDLPAGVDTGRIGQRVYVRFHHGSEALGRRLYRSVRRLFLRRLHV